MHTSYKTLGPARYGFEIIIPIFASAERGGGLENNYPPLEPEPGKKLAEHTNLDDRDIILYSLLRYRYRYLLDFLHPCILILLSVLTAYCITKLYNNKRFLLIQSKFIYAKKIILAQHFLCEEILQISTLKSCLFNVQ